MACSPIGAYDRRQNQYNKTLSLGERAKKIIALADKENFDALSAKLAACGELPQGAFDQYVEHAGMHMWLTKNMHIAELQYATAVTELLKLTPAALDKIQAIITAEAQRAAQTIPADIDAQDAFGYLYKFYLDGMPCDEVRVIKENTPRLVSWDTINDTHTRFWEQADGRVEIYYQMLQLFMDKLFSHTSIKAAVTTNGSFELAQI